MSVPYYRWSDNDLRWGRFIYSRNGSYNPLGVALASSGDDEDDRAFNTLRFSGFGHTFIIVLPPIIKPAREWVDTSRYGWANNPRGGYWELHKREISFALIEGALHLRFGRQTHDSTTDRSKCFFLPWKQWRHVRRSLYGLEGEHAVDMPQWGGRPARVDWKIRHAEECRLEALAPTATFAFHDFDGEALTATTRIEEREWRRGTGWFRWLSLVWPNRVERYIDIQFSGETGRRKGSWKGGTIGHSGPVLPGELHEAAFRRYCAAHDMTFVGPAAPTPEQQREAV